MEPITMLTAPMIANALTYFYIAVSAIIIFPAVYTGGRADKEK
jgi:hypothetical protein